MSDVCVCGCTKEQHDYVHEQSHYPEFRSVEIWTACEKHGCCNFRPCLDWPNEFHKAWFSRNTGEMVLSVGNSIISVKIWNANVYGREHWEKLFGPDRFTKCEPNPFVEK